MEKKIKLYRKIFLVCVIISFSVQLVYIFSPNLQFGLGEKVVLFFVQMISLLAWNYFDLCVSKQKEHKNKLLRVHWIIFVIYCLNLMYILFLDPDFGRNVSKQTISFCDYIKYNVNIDLFKTIQLFIYGYQSGIVSLETLLRNLLGNLIVFMPLAYFLPVLFKKQRKFISFFITLFLIVLSVEVIQVFFRIGSGDIDDLFLNVLGGVIMFLILKCFPLYRIYDILERK